MKMLRSRVGTIVFALATFLLVATAAQAQLPGLPDAGKALPKPAPVPAPAPTEATATDASSGGNSSDQSVGVVQVGPVTADPMPVVADTPLAGAVATTKTTIGNTGGNQSSQSGGVAQVGGDNTATGSVGVLQVSHSESNTGVAARVVGTHVGADAGALIGGNGTNTANGSAVEVQVGSGNTANGSTAALQVQPSTAGVGIRADAGPLAPALKANVSISANEVLGRALGIDLSMLGASLGRQRSSSWTLSTRSFRASATRLGCSDSSTLACCRSEGTATTCASTSVRSGSRSSPSSGIQR